MPNKSWAQTLGPARHFLCEISNGTYHWNVARPESLHSALAQSRDIFWGSLPNIEMKSCGSEKLVCILDSKVR